MITRTCEPSAQDLCFGRVNSKATARFFMKDLYSCIPKILHEHLRKSRYYAEKSEALIFQADESRKQSENTQECFRKLKELILAAGKTTIKGETSPAKKARLKSLYVPPVYRILMIKAPMVT